MADNSESPVSKPSGFGAGLEPTTTSAPTATLKKKSPSHSAPTTQADNLLVVVIASITSVDPVDRPLTTRHSKDNQLQSTERPPSNQQPPARVVARDANATAVLACLAKNFPASAV